MVTPDQKEQILSALEKIISSSAERATIPHEAMQLIARYLPHYNWVGIYILDGGILVLGPYIGAATEHTTIPIGRGVCGTAVATGENQVVTDVRTLDNYLSCSVETRSEIVVLIRDPQSGAILGQIDADGHTVGAFDQSDEELLEIIAHRLAPYLLSETTR